MIESPEQWAERSDGLVVSLHGATSSVHRPLYRTRVRTSRWRSIRRGVAAINGTPRTWRQIVRAAVLAAGPQAVASHFTALALYAVVIRGLNSDDIHLSAPAGRKVRMSGVVGHRFQNIEPGDVSTRWGMPTATPLRIVIDLSGHCGDAQLGQLIDEFLRRQLLSLSDLSARVERLRPAPGRSVARLKRVLHARSVDYVPGDSELEGRILRLLAAHGFPTPTSQYWVRRDVWSARIDHAYPDVKLYIESDGFGFHQFASDLDNDSRRRNRLVVEGWRPLTFTWRMADREIVATMDAVFDRSTGVWRPPS